MALTTPIKRSRCDSKALDYFTDFVKDDNFFNHYTERIFPNIRTPIDISSNLTLRIDIPPAEDYYMDPFQSILNLKFKIIKRDGTKVTNKPRVAFITGQEKSIFKKIFFKMLLFLRASRYLYKFIDFMVQRSSG